MKRSIARRVTMATSLVATVLAAANCFGPTEVTVKLSTDLSCAERVTTGIFKGQYGAFEDVAQAETTACTDVVAGSDIGTIVVVPSSERDGKAAVKIVAAIGGKAPRDCDKDATNCIIARRAFEFADHRSRSLSIRLSRDCIGVRCAETETCVEGPARCVDSTTSCEGSACLLPSERPDPAGGEGGVVPPGSDGGAPDGATDAGSTPDGGTDPLPTVEGCIASTGYLATDAFPDERRAAASATTLYWVPSDHPERVMQVAKTGGAPEVAYVAPGDAARIRAIAVDGLALGVAYQVGSTRWVKPPVGNALVVPTGYDMHDITVAAAPGPLVYVSTQNLADLSQGEVFELAGSTFDTPGNLGGTRLAADLSNVYVGSADGVKVMPRNLSSFANATGAPKSPAFARATDNGEVFAGGVRTSNVLVSFNGANVSVVRSNLATKPTALAVDQGYIFYGGSDGSLYRTSRFAGVGAPIVLSSEGSGAVIDHVFVDPLPGTGCVYYWVKSQGETKGRLVVRPKTQP